MGERMTAKELFAQLDAEAKAQAEDPVIVALRKAREADEIARGLRGEDGLWIWKDEEPEPEDGAWAEIDGVMMQWDADLGEYVSPQEYDNPGCYDETEDETDD